ncbi:hypothetical protein SAMN05216179_1448 [Gracilibacillus kekensis]|uniref:DUF8042 domain-containing protein n=2 Tax=Gracilibacillus kekensis TaxID=1027249 RepID=A0A1M7MZX5_9BACI|nr:hypothetical protein SAMN05216179_1448 [Gracilibacillus kekensis]
MKIILNDEEQIIKQTVEKKQGIIETIDKLVDGNILSHIIINDYPIYIEIEDYIDRHLNDIEKIQIITKTKSEFVNDTLLTAENYLEHGINAIEHLADQFYQTPTQEDWNQFKNFTDGLNWINNVILNIDSLKERPSNWNDYVKIYHDLENGVRELAEAVEGNDEILIADIINYEIKSIYEKLNKLITTTIDTEGCRPNAN